MFKNSVWILAVSLTLFFVLQRINGEVKKSANELQNTETYDGAKEDVDSDDKRKREETNEAILSKKKELIRDYLERILRRLIKEDGYPEDMLSLNGHSNDEENLDSLAEGLNSEDILRKLYHDEDDDFNHDVNDDDDADDDSEDNSNEESDKKRKKSLSKKKRFRMAYKKRSPSSHSQFRLKRFRHHY